MGLCGNISSIIVYIMILLTYLWVVKQSYIKILSTKGQQALTIHQMYFYNLHYINAKIWYEIRHYDGVTYGMVYHHSPYGHKC